MQKSFDETYKENNTLSFRGDTDRSLNTKDNDKSMNFQNTEFILHNDTFREGTNRTDNSENIETTYRLKNRCNLTFEKDDMNRKVV